MKQIQGLAKLKELLDSGAINQSEYDNLKDNILNSNPRKIKSRLVPLYFLSSLCLLGFIYFGVVYYQNSNSKSIDCTNIKEIILDKDDINAQIGYPFTENEEKFYKKIWEANEDLDGDGIKDVISIYVNGTQYFNDSESVINSKAKIVVNDLAVDFTFFRGENSYWGKYEADSRFKIVDIAKGDKYKEILIRQKDEGEEDPATENTIVRFINCKTLTCTRIPGGGYNAGEFHITDNGMFTIKTDYTFDDMNYYFLSKSGIKLDHRNEVPRPVDYVPAACPFVYVFDYNGLKEKKGEILRNLIGLENKKWQSLCIGKSNNSLVHVQIAEEKLERTYIDSIRLKIDGNYFYPINFNQKGIDNAILQLGDTLDLIFQTQTKGENMHLECKGYYIRQ